jgi:glycosyltransferase involved in cell wall biosynthesis
MPLVSLIVPIYNVEKYLDACLGSIANQTYCEFECICIDDGSPDRSAAIAQGYAERDYRFRVIRQSNQGLAGARNSGIDNATGDYITFVDSDDFIHRDALKIFCKSAFENAADYVSASFKTVDENSYWENFICENPPKDSFPLMITSNPIVDWLEKWPDNNVMACSRLYSRNLFKDIRFDTEMRIHEDTYFCPLIMARSQKAVFTSEPIYYYRQRKGSLIRSNSFRESLNALAKNLELVANLANELNLSQKNRDLLLGNCGVIYFSVVATNLVLNDNLPRDERHALFLEARRVFKTLKAKKHFKHSMVVAKSNRIALLLAYELRAPSVFRAFYRLVWPDRWQRRIALES